jgi:hypothetical protein
VTKAGWEESKRLVSEAIKAKAEYPIGYALEVWKRQETKRQVSCRKKRPDEMIVGRDIPGQLRVN